jgi:hypothetical protein
METTTIWAICEVAVVFGMIWYIVNYGPRFIPPED